MPDHIHLLVFITKPTELQLGNYIGMMKVAVLQSYRSIGYPEGKIFEDDFFDCILYRSRSLDTIFKYIRDNPKRLAARRLRPDFFTRVDKLQISDQVFQAYGNCQLLSSPFKEQVVVHRADTTAIRQKNRDTWLYTASNGGILVSPFISAAEKEIRVEAEALGARFILIVHESFPDRYKPAGHDFDLCEQGRLLIISLGTNSALTRQTCLAMNTLAATISHLDYPC